MNTSNQFTVSNTYNYPVGGSSYLISNVFAYQSDELKITTLLAHQGEFLFETFFYDRSTNQEITSIAGYVLVPSASFDSQFIAGHNGSGGGLDWKLWKITPKAQPTVNVTVSPSSVTEDGSQVLTYTFTRTGSTSSALTVNFSVSGAASRSSDYTSSSFSGSTGTVLIAGGGTSASAAVVVDPTADSTVESDETVTLTVTSGTGYAVGSPSSATGTITNDDAAATPTISVTVSPSSVVEGGSVNLIYTFSRSSTSGSLTAGFSVSGTATSGVDYTISPSSSVSFSSGSSSATVTVTPTSDSNNTEGSETVTLTVNSGSGYTVSGSPATGTITDPLDLYPVSVFWDDLLGGLTLKWNVTGALSQTATAKFYWANGAGQSSKLSSTPFYSASLPYQSGQALDLNVPSSSLTTAAPAGTTHVAIFLDENNQVAESSDSNNFVSVADVKLTGKTVNTYSSEVVKGMLRYAGQSSATVTSTQRTPQHQGEVMFDNAFKEQFGGTKSSAQYASPGRQVLAVYQQMTLGKTRQQVEDPVLKKAIIDAMVAKINTFKPTTQVSRHCGDPNLLTVLDIAPSGFSFASGVNFAKRALGSSSVQRFLGPTYITYAAGWTTIPYDKAFHIEIPQPGAGSSPQAMGQSALASLDGPAAVFAGGLTFVNGEAAASGTVSSGEVEYTFYANQGQVAYFGLSVTQHRPGSLWDDTDAGIYILDPQGRILASNDDAPESGYDSSIDGVTINATGTHRLVVVTHGNAPILNGGSQVVGWQSTGGSNVDYALSLYLLSASVGESLLASTNPIIAVDSDITAGSSYPGTEAPVNLLDGNANTKYLNFRGQGSGFIVTPGASVIKSFILTTGDDHEERDPATYQIYGTNNTILSADNSTGNGGESWTLISSGALSMPAARKAAAAAVSFTNTASYSSYKVIFPTLKDGVEFQLSGASFYTGSGGTGTSVLNTGNAIKAIAIASSQSAFPPNEGPAQAIDGIASSKFLNNGDLNSGFIVTPVAQSVVTSFRIWTGNDHTERDPAAYQLYGTNSAIVSAQNTAGTAESWTPIASGTLSLPAARQDGYTVVSFANTTAYRSYKWIVTGLKGPSGNEMQFGEIQFFGEWLHPEIDVFDGTGTLSANARTSSFGTVDYGLVAYGSSSTPSTFTIKNSGSVNLTGLSITKTGTAAADFTVSTLGSTTIAPGGSLSFTVTFSPGYEGARDAVINVASNDVDENPFEIYVFGTGPDVSSKMLSPVDGSALTSALATFNWDAGYNVTNHALWLGSTLGGYDIYAGNEGNGLNRTVTLPDDGRTVYATLWSLVGGSYRSRQYSYTAFRAPPAVKAQLTGPSLGSALSSTTLPLVWNAGVGVSQYALYVGTVAGGYDLYAAIETETSRTVTVPPDRRIYVTLWSLIKGAWLPNYYVFDPVPSVKASLSWPYDGFTLSDSSLNISWDVGTGVSGCALWLGSSPNSYDLGVAWAGTGSSWTFSNVPQDGGPVYLTLWSLINGAWMSNSYWFVTATPDSGYFPARLSSPANGDTLWSSSFNLSWDAGSGATSYVLWIGSSPNGYDLYAGAEGTNLSKDDIAVPGDGRRIYVTLFSLIGGAYLSNSYYFTCANLPDKGAAQITSPGSGWSLADADLPLAWNSVPGASAYYLWAGDAPFGYNRYAGAEGLNLSRTLTGMPMDGSPVYVTLYSLVRGIYLPSTAWFNTANAWTGNQRARMTWPPNDSTLWEADTTFTWDGGTGVTSCALWIGSNPGSYDLFAAALSPDSSRNVTLPTDGRKIYATLWSLIGGVYQSNGWQFTAATQAAAKADIVSPPKGSTIGGSSVTFDWNPVSGARQYTLWIGRKPGGYDVYAGAEGTSTSKTITTMPMDGGPVYVTLWSLIKGAWQSTESIYQAANP